MSSIWKKYRKSSDKEKFSMWLQWAQLNKKPYQVSAFEWHKRREMVEEHKGGIFADEMGLGKTIVMLGHIYCHPVKRTLIVLPNALLAQWNDCIMKYIMSLPYRWLMRKEYGIFHGANRYSVEDLRAKRIVVTTYGTMVSRLDTLKEIPWDRIVFDEAHHLRVPNTRIFKAAAALKPPIHWFMTGTPIQNCMKDLYSLLRLLGFSSRQYTSREGLDDVMSDCLLRRTKKSVGIRLRPMKVYVKRVPWEGDEEEALSAQIHSLTHFMASKSGGIYRPLQIGHLAAFIRSRQMCIYPKTIQAAIEDGKTLDFLAEIAPAWDKMTSSKIKCIVSKLCRRARNGTRKLVFCHYRREIDELSRQLKKAGLLVGIVDGRTPQKTRDMLLAPLIQKDMWNKCLPRFHTSTTLPFYKMVTDFLKPEVLLVQIQTSSEGLNLQDFSEVYFTSPHWNPALEDQAIARCHRIGQKRPVKVFRFIMDCHEDNGITLDEYCSFVQTHKRAIFDSVFD
jgi:SNF2 family DNA or RNA helicase